MAPTPDPTTSWETYTNRRYGYQIKHPDRLVIHASSDEEALTIDYPGPSDTPLLRLDVYETAVGPESWWAREGQQRYPWLFNVALNHIEATDPKRYGDLVGVRGLNAVAQRRSPGGPTLPASVLLLSSSRCLFVILDDTDLFVGDALNDNWEDPLDLQVRPQLGVLRTDWSLTTSARSGSRSEHGSHREHRAER